MNCRSHYVLHLLRSWSKNLDSHQQVLPSPCPRLLPTITDHISLKTICQLILLLNTDTHLAEASISSYNLYCLSHSVHITCAHAIFIIYFLTLTLVMSLSLHLALSSYFKPLNPAICEPYMTPSWQWLDHNPDITVFQPRPRPWTVFQA